MILRLFGKQSHRKREIIPQYAAVWGERGGRVSISFLCEDLLVLPKPPKNSTHA